MKRRFLPPVGTPEERLSGKVPPGHWFDATGFGRNTTPKYTLGYHTGWDGNLNVPHFNADEGAPVYAIGEGEVIYARIGPGTWGLLVVINHGLVDSLPCFSRTAHGKNLKVRVGQRVDEWTHLCDVGNAEGAFAAHLHFDISTTLVLNTQAWHWPGWNLGLLEDHYVDPMAWLRVEHEVEGDDMPDEMIIKAANGLPLLNELPFSAGTQVVANERVVIGANSYRKITVGGREGWMLEADGSGVYLAVPSPILTMYVNADPLNIREQPTTASAKIGTLAFNAQVRVQETGVVANSYTWVKLVDQAGYVAKGLLRANP